MKQLLKVTMLSMFMVSFLNASSKQTVRIVNSFQQCGSSGLVGTCWWVPFASFSGEIKKLISSVEDSDVISDSVVEQVEILSSERLPNHFCKDSEIKNASEILQTLNSVVIKNDATMSVNDYCQLKSSFESLLLMNDLSRLQQKVYAARDNENMRLPEEFFYVTEFLKAKKLNESCETAPVPVFSNLTDVSRNLYNNVQALSSGSHDFAICDVVTSVSYLQKQEESVFSTMAKTVGRAFSNAWEPRN